MTESAPDSPPPVSTARGCLLMLFAPIGGYALLGILAVFMLREPSWQLSLADIAFWIVALLIPLAQREYGKMGFAADLATLTKHGLVAHVAAAIALWALARSIYIG